MVLLPCLCLLMFLYAKWLCSFGVAPWLTQPWFSMLKGGRVPTLHIQAWAAPLPRAAWWLCMHWPLCKSKEIITATENPPDVDLLQLPSPKSRGSVILEGGCGGPMRVLMGVLLAFAHGPTVRERLPLRILNWLAAAAAGDMACLHWNKTYSEISTRLSLQIRPPQ